MKKLFFSLLLLVFIIPNAFSQKREIPTDTVITTSHQATINGQNFNYEAKVGTLPVWNKDNEPIATLFYTYYKRSLSKPDDSRPLVFSFNGGPGSASVWMHIGYTGPKILNLDKEGMPVQPYGVKDNPYSILDVADIVYVDPVNTGYSRMVKNKEGKDPDRSQFFGINADIKYLAEWMNTFVSRYNRWNSPKFIIGESYGGTRVMGLAEELQNKQWMYLNGVIMVSPADYKLYNNGLISSAINIPYFTAASWYHNKLPSDLQNRELESILPESEQFAINEVLPALVNGAFLNESRKQQLAEKMAKYTGLDKERILDQNLDLSTFYFWKELLRDDKLIIGRLDSRYLGIDKKDTGDRPEYFPELTSWNHSFTPPINHYLKNDLEFVTDTKYNMFGDVHPWDLTENNTRDRLRQAMAQNPYLNVLVQSGYYDGATTYFQAKLTMGLVDPSGKMKDRLNFKAYKSGHMMYVRDEDLKQSTADLRNFILKSTGHKTSAKYDNPKN
ncbi:carboxypeptidase [Mangrovimonas sp. CR14]|uniref:S10 family peptidase n=1 Tax=Mangrovimonas sp. CR14 TaxID=2706120 RepID=UPI001420F1EA|nr:carboxypeptidase [Mangrovimonas sp. CR14]NIK91921.1 carboxypeptidase [Mangrovimonas sp. CR14]